MMLIRGTTNSTIEPLRIFNESSVSKNCLKLDSFLYSNTNDSPLFNNLMNAVIQKKGQFLSIKISTIKILWTLLSMVNICPNKP